MPDKKSSKNEESDDTGKGGSKKMILSAVLSVALLGAGYFVGGMSSGGDSAPVAEAADGEESEAEEEKKEVGHLVDLEPINVNLQDGHFLRIAISLDTHVESSGGGHGKEEAAFPTAMAADLVLSTFSGRHMDDLSTEEGREEARAALMEGLEAVYGEEVAGVYLTEFVMQ